MKRTDYQGWFIAVIYCSLPDTKGVFPRITKTKQMGEKRFNLFFFDLTVTANAEKIQPVI